MMKTRDMIGKKVKQKPVADADEPVLILTTYHQIWMDMVREALEGEKIPVLMTSVTGYHGRGMLPFEQGFFNYRVFVPRKHVTRAREIVETIVPREVIE